MIFQDSSFKDTIETVVSALAGKGGSWYDVPAVWALLGVLAHLYAKWGDKKRFAKITFWQYISHPLRMKTHIVTFAMIGVWTANLGIAGYSFRDVIPYHWVTGLLYGYFTDSLLKLAVKQVPAIGAVLGAKRDSSGEMVMPTVGMPAVPPPEELRNPRDS